MSAPVAGSTLPDVELQDADGIPRRLSELAAGDPLVVHFYRGWFCPKDRAWLRDVLVPLQGALEVAYTRVVSISVEPPAVQAAYRAGLDARWVFLSDHERTYQASLGLREWTDTVHDPYVPTVLVTRPDLHVHSSYNGYWFWGRPSADDLWRDLREVTRGLRPDWEVPHG